MKKLICSTLLTLPLITYAATTPEHHKHHHATATKAATSTTTLTAKPTIISPAAQQLINLLQKLHTMQANFIQTYYDSSGSASQKSRGQMALEHPGKFRWQTTSPMNQLLITDGKYVWMYNQDLKQASRTLLDPEQMTNPASLLSGSPELLAQRFNVFMIPNTNSSSNSSFKLQPKKPNDLFQWIELYFNGDTLVQMRMSDNLGHLSQLNFSDVKMNTALNAGLFGFITPKGVDLIKQK